MFKSLDTKLIHSVTVGNFRMPLGYLKKLSKLKPEDKFIQSRNIDRIFSQKNRFDEEKFKEFCLNEIHKYVDINKVFLN